MLNLICSWPEDSKMGFMVLMITTAMDRQRINGTRNKNLRRQKARQSDMRSKSDPADWDSSWNGSIESKSPCLSLGARRLACYSENKSGIPRSISTLDRKSSSRQTSDREPLTRARWPVDQRILIQKGIMVTGRPSINSTMARVPSSRSASTSTGTGRLAAGVPATPPHS